MSSWRSRANCLGIDPEIFFPGEKDRVGLKQAKSYCKSCPVKQECEDFAVETDAREGVFGGKTYAERLLYNVILTSMQPSSVHALDTVPLSPLPSLQPVAYNSSQGTPKLGQLPLAPITVAVGFVEVA